MATDRQEQSDKGDCRVGERMAVGIGQVLATVGWLITIIVRLMRMATDTVALTCLHIGPEHCRARTRTSSPMADARGSKRFWLLLFYVAYLPTVAGMSVARAVAAKTAGKVPARWAAFAMTSQCLCHSPCHLKWKVKDQHFL